MNQGAALAPTIFISFSLLVIVLLNGPSLCVVVPCPLAQFFCARLVFRQSGKVIQGFSIQSREVLELHGINEPPSVFYV